MQAHGKQGNVEDPWESGGYTSKRGENEIGTIRRIIHVVSRFPLQFMLYRGNLDFFLCTG